MGLVVRHVINLVQRLAGASILVFANKQDLPGALSVEEIQQVRLSSEASTLAKP